MQSFQDDAPIPDTALRAEIVELLASVALLLEVPTAPRWDPAERAACRPHVIADDLLTLLVHNVDYRRLAASLAASSNA